MSSVSIILSLSAVARCLFLLRVSLSLPRCLQICIIPFHNSANHFLFCTGFWVCSLPGNTHYTLALVFFHFSCSQAVFFKKMTIEPIMDDPRDQFPIGLRVLAVDDDPTCLFFLENLLRRCQYHGSFLVLPPFLPSFLCVRLSVFDMGSWIFDSL